MHVHLLVTEGALQVGGVWQPVRWFPPQEYRRRWQYQLLRQLRQALPKDDPAQRQLGRLCGAYPDGFIVNVQSRYGSARKALSYCCRYLARPPLGERAIRDYDGQTLLLEYKDSISGQLCQQRCGAQQLVELLLQHVLPRYARNIHYYGLYRPQVWREWFQKLRLASRYPQNVGGPAPAHLTWRQRIMLAFEVDPVLCPNCGTAMVVHQIRCPPRRRAPPEPIQLPLPLPVEA